MRVLLTAILLILSSSSFGKTIDLVGRGAGYCDDCHIGYHVITLGLSSVPDRVVAHMEGVKNAENDLIKQCEDIDGNIIGSITTTFVEKKKYLSGNFYYRYKAKGKCEVEE